MLSFINVKEILILIDTALLKDVYAVKFSNHACPFVCTCSVAPHLPKMPFFLCSSLLSAMINISNNIFAYNEDKRIYIERKRKVRLFA